MSRRALLLAVIFVIMNAVGQQAPSTQASPARPAPGQSTPSATNAQPGQEIPVIDGGLGPCSLELQVNDGLGKPVFGVKVDVHIAYGFMGIRKMDLEAQTNVNGRVKFAGLPAKVHSPPLEFKATKDQLTGIATTDPASECQATHDIVLEKPKPSDVGGPSPSPAP